MTTRVFRKFQFRCAGEGDVLVVRFVETGPPVVVGAYGDNRPAFVDLFSCIYKSMFPFHALSAIRVIDDTRFHEWIVG